MGDSPASRHEVGADARPTARGLSRPVALGLGPLLFAAVLLAPLPALSPTAHRLAGVFVWAVAYWVGAAIPLWATAIGSSALAVALGAGDWRTVALSYADPVILLFLGSFVVAAALRDTGLDRRFAWALLRQRWATRTPRRLLGTFGAICCALSLWLSNTATTALLLPVGQGVLASVAPGLDRAAPRFGIALMLMLTWGSSVAVALPVGSPPNLIAIGLLRQLGGRELTLLDWVAVGMPLTIAMLGLSWLILAWRYVPAQSAIDPDGGGMAEMPIVGAWQRRERVVLAVFLAVCGLWAWPPTARHEWLVAVAGAAALLVVPIQRQPWAGTLPWRQALRIDWGTLILFGGGIALGRLMFESGLAEAMGRALVKAAGVESVWGLTAVAIATGVLLSETASNTASASVVVPVMIAVSLAAGVSPVPPALGAALGASFGFMLPVSTPPNAIVYGSGAVPLREMIRSGLLLDVLGGVAIWLGLRILCPIAGLV